MSCGIGGGMKDIKFNKLQSKPETKTEGDREHETGVVRRVSGRFAES